METNTICRGPNEKKNLVNDCGDFGTTDIILSRYPGPKVSQKSNAFMWLWIQHIWAMTRIAKHIRCTYKKSHAYELYSELCLCVSWLKCAKCNVIPYACGGVLEKEAYHSYKGILNPKHRPRTLCLRGSFPKHTFWIVRPQLWNLNMSQSVLQCCWKCAAVLLQCVAMRCCAMRSHNCRRQPVTSQALHDLFSYTWVSPHTHRSLFYVSFHE